MTVRKLTIPLSKEQEERIEYLSIQYKEEEIITDYRQQVHEQFFPQLKAVVEKMQTEAYSFLPSDDKKCAFCPFALLGGDSCQ